MSHAAAKPLAARHASPDSAGVRAMLERLIAFDTTSAYSNLALIAFVEDYLSGHGVASQRVMNDEGTKANLFATLGPRVAGGVVLSGHSDVVPVTGQPWTSDPFTLVERDGRLYGRGTCDMKAYLAIALALVPEMQAAGLSVPLHLAISYDEEVGCTGVSSMIEAMAKALPPVRAVIIGEPTDMAIINAHKGITSHFVRIRGHEAHSSQPHRGANANMAAGLLIAKLQAMATAREEKPHAGSLFEPPHTTFNVGVVQGGTAGNIIPLDCWFVFEYRIHPGDDAQAILKEFSDYAFGTVEPWLQRNAPEASIRIELRASVPPLLPEPDGAAEALVRHLTGANTAGVVSFGTEGGHFQNAGFSTVICGPGSIDQAHQPDEFISLAQLEAGTAFQRRLIDWARGR